MIATTYLGSGDVSTHRTDYRPEWLDNLADDVTLEGSVLLWSQLMGEHFAGTRYAEYFFSHEPAQES